MLGQSYEVLVGRSEKICRSVHQSGLGLRNVRVGRLVGLVDGQMLEVSKPRLLAHAHGDSCAKVWDLLLNVDPKS